MTDSPFSNSIYTQGDEDVKFPEASAGETAVPVKRKRGRPARVSNKSAQLKKEQQFAIGYVRVSTEEQATTGVSLDAQEERIRAYCSLAGLKLTKIIREEGVSAAKKLLNRPGGEEMHRLLGRGATHVVALKLDRLFRDAVDALERTKQWDKDGIALHLIDMGGQTVSTTSAMGRMMLTMMAAFAELERNLISERTSAAMQHLKRQRKVYGVVPIGYRCVGGELVEQNDEQTVVKTIFEWRFQMGWTLARIAEELNRENVKPFRGGQKWYASTVGKICDNDIHKAAA